MRVLLAEDDNMIAQAVAAKTISLLVKETKSSCLLILIIRTTILLGFDEKFHKKGLIKSNQLLRNKPSNPFILFR